MTDAERGPPSNVTSPKYSPAASWFNHLAALVVRDVDARLAGQDDVERIGVVTFRDDDGSLGKGAHGRDRGDLVEQRLRQYLDRPVLHGLLEPSGGQFAPIVRSHIGADKTPIRRRASRTR